MEAELDDALQRIESKIKDKVSRQCAGLTVHCTQIATRAMLVCKMCKVVQKKSEGDTYMAGWGHKEQLQRRYAACSAVQIIMHKCICFDSEMYLSNLFNVFVCVCRSDVVCRTHIVGRGCTQRAGSVAVCSPSLASPYPPPPPPPRQRQPKLINT